MSIYQIIRAEIDGNTGLYGAMTDQQVADELNAVDKVQNKTSISGSDIFERTDSGEFALLSDAKKAQWLALCAIESIDPFNVLPSIGVNIFGGGSTTGTNIVAFRTETVSRASQLGLGFIYEADVTIARAQ